ncbi:hypothetical protein COZ81_02455 [Candidatus Jorgensenbacteria bacterium CG_4_8_14_3_um_filter_38_10]|nr:MAG: hypothetical protein COS46_01770 [Candidatus Jorgensenbacteria bacterium CG03_land_8_20_14_0_80_38_39]PIW97460.1 MAG: hypothetical protein COZ81_02455 [Candidatus Jorgensenbacteria bacterium CG_4_8_14_3_um_filter_38_10]
MANKKIKIGIIGLGYVGGAVKNWFEKQKNRYELFFYDKHKKIGSIDEVNQADIIFIAVPTPFREDGRGYDDSAVRESLKNIKDGKIIVIKSTALPGSTDRFQKLYPKKIILFNPEFLRAKTAVKDFLRPPMQLVGYTGKRSKKIAPKILNILPKASFKKIIKAREAEMVKYFINTFLATRVIFANQIYDLCRKLKGINYKMVKDCVIQDKRIGYSHFDIFSDGYRGYGGDCLLKDTKALIQYAKKLRVNLGLIEKVDEINNKLIKQKMI